VTVGRTQHQLPPLASPSLCLQLLTGIEGEAAAALPGGLPCVQAGPDATDPAGLPLAQQQGAALFGGSRQEHPLENRQRLPTDPQQLWRPVIHTGTLCSNP